MFSLFAVLVGTAASGATSVSQFGITWKFDRDYPTGQFANGDYWVIGPVKIVSITPATTVVSGATLHGSMINPVPNAAQGFDSRIKNNTFASSANVGKCPRTIAAGSSLLSAESYATAATGDNPQLKTIAVLTVLASAPPAGSFRPAYSGSDKAVRWNKSQLNYSKLRSLPAVANTPALASVEALFERPWIEQKTNWTGRYMHPGANQPTYGRELAHTLAQGLLSLQLNYTNAQKEKLLVRLVQYGIDIYGAAKSGAVWGNDGGHNQGRKMPLLLAAATLGDSEMLAWADASKHFIFHEDQQTWFVGKSDVGRPLEHDDGRPRVEYISADVGVPEWGEKHTGVPDRDGRNWDTYYRDVSGCCTVGHVLTARLMGLETKWNWAPIFDYYDRFWGVMGGSASSGPNSIQLFVASMWKAYRGGTPATFTDDNVATSIWQNNAFTAQSGAFTIAFDLMPSKTYMDGSTGLSNGAADAYTDLAASVRLAPSGIIDVRNGSSYMADALLTYAAGVKYHVVMTVDVSTKRYSVTVTPAGKSAVKLANNYAFRTEQAAVKTLSNIGFIAATGAHAVLDVGVQASSSTSTSSSTATASSITSTATVSTSGGTASVSTSTSTSSTSSSMPVVKLTSSSSWQNVTLPAITGTATIAFDLKPASYPVDTITAITNGSADAYSDLAVAIRLNSAGRFDAINGSSWSAKQSITYAAGVTYRVSITINRTKHVYSATVTPAGGPTVTLASDFSFRNGQTSVAQLNNLTAFAAAGSHTVTNATLSTN